MASETELIPSYKFRWLEYLARGAKQIKLQQAFIDDLTGEVHWVDVPTVSENESSE